MQYRLLNTKWQFGTALEFYEIGKYSLEWRYNIDQNWKYYQNLEWKLNPSSDISSRLSTFWYSGRLSINEFELTN